MSIFMLLALQVSSLEYGQFFKIKSISQQRLSLKRTFTLWNAREKILYSKNE